MAFDYVIYRQHLTLGAGVPQTITPSTANHKIRVMYADFYSAAANSLSILVGTFTVCNGATTISPVQLKFGNGQGGGVAGASLVITATGAATMDIGWVEVI